MIHESYQEVVDLKNICKKHKIYAQYQGTDGGIHSFNFYSEYGHPLNDKAFTDELEAANWKIRNNSAVTYKGEDRMISITFYAQNPLGRKAALEERVEKLKSDLALAEWELYQEIAALKGESWAKK